YDQKEGTYISPRVQRWSIFGRESLRPTEDLALFTEGLFTRRKIQTLQESSNPLILSVPESNPFYVNPTRTPGAVTVYTGTSAFFGPLVGDGRVDTGNFSLGATASTSQGWIVSGGLAYTFEKQHQVSRGFYDRAALDAALADPDPATAFNPFGDGANTNPATLANIQGLAVYDSTSSLKTANFSIRGATISLPGGDIETSLGAEYRIQSIATASLLPGATADASGQLSRRVAAAFGELRVPIIAEDNQLSLARRLELSLGIRHERFSDIGDATI